MKNKDLLLVGGALVVLYLLSRKSIGALDRGYYVRKEIDQRPGCHKGEIASFIKRAV